MAQLQAYIANAILTNPQLAAQLAAYLSANNGTVDNNVSDNNISSSDTPVAATPNLQSLVTQLPSTTNGSTLGFVDLRASKSGATINLGGLENWDIQTSMNSSVNDGWVEESIVNYFHDVCILGDAPVIESVFSTRKDDAHGGGYLEPAWSPEDETAFKNYCTNNGKNDLAFKQACQIWPLVFAAYRVSINYLNRLAGALGALPGPNSEAVTYARIRPTLVSGYSQSAGGNPRNWIPRPINIEINTPGSGNTNWYAASQYDRLELSHDGQYFTINALRDQGPGYNSTWYLSQGSAYDGGYMFPMNIRATLALELEWRICGRNKDDPNNADALVAGGNDDGLANKYTYTVLTEEGDYVLWLRYDSFPLGQLLPKGYGLAPDRLVGGDPGPLFADWTAPGKGRINEHALARIADVHRIESSGQFEYPRFVAGLLPGVTIAEVLNASRPIKGVVVRTTLCHSSQKMQVEMASAAENLPELSRHS